MPYQNSNLVLLEKQSNNLLLQYEHEITHNPCCKFKFLYNFNTQIKKVVSNDLNAVDRIINQYNFNILKTIHSKFFIYSMFQTCQTHKPLTSSLTLSLLVIYMLLINKHIPYCNNRKLLIAFGNLRSNHLLKLYGTPVNACKHLAGNLSKELLSQSFHCDDNYMYIRLYMKYRTILAQSVKRIATQYMQLKKENLTKPTIDSYLHTIINSISLYGIVKVSNSCKSIENNLNKLVDIDSDLLEQSVYEVLVINGINPSKQKIINNINKLKATKEVAKQIGLPDTSFALYCLCVTYYEILKEH